MKKLLLLIILSATISTKAYALNGNLVTCWQHDEFAGRVNSPSNDPAVLRTLCHAANYTKPEAQLREISKAHNINSPECWRGKKENLGGSEGGN